MADRFFWLEPGATIFTPGAFNELTAPTLGVARGQGGTGLHMPPIRRTHLQVAGLAGTRLQTIQHDMRVVDLPFRFAAGSEEALRALLRTWRRRLDPLRGPGQLWCIADDGRAFILTGHYVQGLELDESTTNRATSDLNREPSQLAVLAWEADDPYWYDAIEQSAGWVLGGPVPKWFTPRWLPIVLAPSSLTGRATIANAGEVDAWPRWTISGPGSTITVTNVTTGRSFTWAGSLDDTDQLVVDTSPGVKTVTVNGVDAFGLLTGWDMWPLVTGANDVAVSLSESTADSRIDVAYRNGWLGP